ncbi:hypothetical protein PXK00_04665 [Phaeobacter sp. QD34_3]|uniref:NYN domain-containing protein n=1 Tax=unclassified Phaeobacter TaxID=2621772 RepID=UPI00237F5202|nr:MULTISPECIES: hypothetical protein [unclassified Phaeobacter]MDE4132390.1 hypothetical protein [Phaeobacter sp. QD34_3]MDE4136027.1 hypothetical protein [Phaeobacter sp. QD34_24]
MRVQAVLFSISIAATLVAIMVPGLQDLLLLSLPSVLASLILLIRAIAAREKAADTRQPVVLDGSNVMHWRDGVPQLETVREVVSCLTAEGYAPGVIFDANAGYLLSGSYMHDGSLAKALGLPRDRVMVVPKGTPADPAILMAARDLGARIVTNDRYRDWSEDHPEIGTPGHLIRGSFQGGRLSLDL